MSEILKLQYNGLDIVKERAYSNKKINKIIIDANIVSIVVVKTNQEYISYSYDGDNISDLKSEVENDLLYIKCNKKMKTFLNFNSSNDKLIVSIPDNQEIDFIFDVSVGNVKIENINLKSVVISANIGSINIKDCQITDEVKVKNRVGNIRFKNVNEPKIIDIKSDLGSIKFENTYSKNVNLKSNIGSIRYTNNDNSYHIDNLYTRSNVGTVTINVS